MTTPTSLGGGPSPSERQGRVPFALATFAAGCFWGVEYDFRMVPGVTNVTVGYTGGHLDQPTYKEVCYTDTGHAEAVLVEYDPALVSFDQLAMVFFTIHDPTQLNRQGPDRGSQYRSAIFFHSPEQEKLAHEAIARYQPNWKKPIVTEVTAASTFWPAEDYHQRYFEKNGVTGCRIPSSTMDKLNATTK